ncbi:MAG: hypothetical protein H6Q26_1681 [Bacteroidetes bacterium]|uniref:GyrI-like domain-containing protein n=1 Tax=unclassified Chitinophaga TaxID=2619133 RepID=UPI0009D44BFB|nr:MULTISPECIES: GyrI-like domain-containing protein [unclassified Chitinophaga]MBP1651524.1 hypothetical protein [Bacteroidota bacterium]OMP79517.1 hypothetical protein BW716_09150 [[Flexibacter] sp. ATCC 35208]WPV68328.1 GyrI-like domain-containing protein [Chitinophaga sp. LS1]
MSKLDLTKTYKELYTATSKPALLFVPPGHYLSIEGQGDPNGEHFAACTQALYTGAYGIKMHYKKMELDFVVCKLEGLWWVNDVENYKDFNEVMQIPRDQWHWQLLIRMPDFINKNDVKNILKRAYQKKPIQYFNQVYLQTLAEGQSIQILHTGPYATEPVSLQLLHDFMKEKGLTWNGRHHEIYLSDPRKTAPEKLKTILRQPVK